MHWRLKAGYLYVYVNLFDRNICLVGCAFAFACVCACACSCAFNAFSKWVNTGKLTLFPSFFLWMLMMAQAEAHTHTHLLQATQNRIHINVLLFPYCHFSISLLNIKFWAHWVKTNVEREQTIERERHTFVCTSCETRSFSNFRLVTVCGFDNFD